SRLAAVPGVRSVTLALDTPLEGGYSYAANVSLPGLPPEREPPPVYYNWVGPRFFETMGIPLVDGREFDARDDERAPPLVIIGEAVARRYLPDGQPLGRQLQLYTTRAEVVGVAKDVRYSGLRVPPPLVVYRPARQQPAGAMTFLVRTSAEPAV